MHFIDHIGIGATLLDIGTGPGLVPIRILEHRPDLKIIASDFSPQMLTIAEKNFRNRLSSNGPFAKVQTQLSFREANVMDLSQFRDTAIDGIYSTGAIKHFPDPIQGLQQCIRILRAGGKMYFTDFYSECSFKDTWNMGRSFRLPFILKIFALPMLHTANKREAPSLTEIQEWNRFLETEGEAKLEYAVGKPFFSLIYKHKKSDQ